MSTEDSDTGKKYLKLLLLLILIIALFFIIFTLNDSASPDATGAVENQNTDANQITPDNNDTSGQKQKAPAAKKLPSEHTHPAFSQRINERARMVSRQIQLRGVRDPNTLAALRIVPRHSFVRDFDLRRAYGDYPLPIGLGQTISQPYIVGYMTEALKLRGDYKILEIGTGSGYQAAVCAEIVREVFTIEIIKELAESAKKRLRELGYRNVSVKHGDGYFGWAEYGPFDAIIITAAAGLVPPPLIEQLKPDGKMILPLGSPFGVQTLVLITKDDIGKIRSKSLLPVSFVPMLGRVTEAK